MSAESDRCDWSSRRRSTSDAAGRGRTGVATKLAAQGAAKLQRQPGGTRRRMTPDGAVRAMVGGRDYAHSRSTARPSRDAPAGLGLQALRLSGGLRARPDARRMRCSTARSTSAAGSPDNYEERVSRAMSALTRAFAKSLNRVAVQVPSEVGRNNVVEDGAQARHHLADRTTVPRRSRSAPATVTLLEMTGAYAAFANGGDGRAPLRHRPDSDQRPADVLYRAQGDRPGPGRPQPLNIAPDDRRGRTGPGRRPGSRASQPPARPAPARITATPGSSASRPSW